jgi:hypothetical protein
MLLFEFERALFKFSAAKPALEVLFQLPPQIGKRVRAGPQSFFKHDYISSNHQASCPTRQAVQIALRIAYQV